MAVNTPRSALHEAARAWSEAGFAVFPCLPQSKWPATKHGHKDATTDLDQIDKWWTENSNYNVGVSPARSAMFVLDVDPPLGAETLAALEADNGVLPPTLTIRTPRGGLHHWFAGSCPSSVGTERRGLGPKLDTRGLGGYVLIPPSVVVDPDKKIEGAYTYANEVEDIAAAPEWIAEKVVRLTDRHEAVGDVGIDRTQNIERALALLRYAAGAGDIAVEGRGGDDKTFQTAASVLALGVSPRRTWELMRDEWNPHCIPPWSEDELATKVQNAADYMQNEIGAWAIPPATETFAAFARAVPGDVANVEQVRRASRFYPRDETEQNALKDPEWLLKDLLPAEATAILYGPPGSWKSFLALDLALTLSSGIARYGAPERPPVDTVYIAAEGSRGIVRLRRPAWRLAHGIDRPLPFYAIDTMPLIARPQDVVEVVEAIKARGIDPKLLVVDTVARALAGKNENDAKDVGEFIEAMDMLKRALRCTVLAIHHTGKDHDRGARGSSAFLGGVDTMLEVKAHHTTKALSLHVRKQKDADEVETPWTFEGQVVGPSLVFFETDTATHHKLTKADDTFSPIKVGAALRSLKAVGEPNAISTNVLATHLVPQLQNETPDERSRAVSRASQQLGALAKTRLEAYTIGFGRALKWCLPAGDEV
jgi:hypothetical protein